MSEIIDLFSMKENFQKDKPEVIKLLDSVRKIYSKYYDECKSANYFDDYSKDNLDFLTNNFNYINNRFTEDSNIFVVSNFVNGLNKLIKNHDDSLSNLYTILFYYNIYRICGKKMFLLSDENLSILIECFFVFDEDYGIKNLDQISDVFYNKKLIDEINQNKGDSKLKDIIIDILDEYLKNRNQNKNNIPYYANEELKLLKSSEDEKRSNDGRMFKQGVLTPKIVHDGIEDVLDSFKAFSDNASYLNDYYERLNGVIKNLESLSEEDKLVIYPLIFKIDQGDAPLLGKINTILNIIDAYIPRTHIK